MGRALTHKEFLERARKRHGDIYDYSKSFYASGTNKICIICRIHGDFFQSPHNHMIGQGCPLCGVQKTSACNKKPINRKDFINKATKIHNDTFDYSKTDPIIYMTKKTTIICKKHGEFLQTVQGHYQKQGCFKCSRELVGEKSRKSQKQFIEEAVLVHGNLYDYSKVAYIRNSEKVAIICKKHGEFLQTPMAHLHGDKIGNGCPRCLSSCGENKIRDWLKSRGLNFKEQKKFKDCRYINPLRFDFYLPQENICIEYDGEQHFRPISIFGGKEALKKSKEKDAIKKAYCKNTGIHLIRISYKSLKRIKVILNQYFKGAFDD